MDWKVEKKRYGNLLVAKQTAGAQARKHYDDIRKKEVLETMKSMQEANNGVTLKNLWVQVAEVEKVPLGNLGGWLRNKDKIYKSAGAINLVFAMKFNSQVCSMPEFTDFKFSDSQFKNLWILGAGPSP